MFFHLRLEDNSLVMLDGLDEAPSYQDRQNLAKLVQNAARAYPSCQFVVTSRPAAYGRDVVLPEFVTVWIDDLEYEAIETFLTRWCEALFAEAPGRAQTHKTELLRALRSRVEIRRMARNPVMLTALAVVHWHEKRLPEQRADLYESILDWLAKAREARPGRPAPERCIGLLQNLALAMQAHSKGRQVQAPRHWAAWTIAPAWREARKEDRPRLAERFLVEEELDSGIVVGRGDDIRFWHLTFQEYLAARALAGQDNKRVWLYRQPELFQSEWREVVLLLAGVLHHQGVERVDGMIAAVLDRIGNLGKRASLEDYARCVGLLGAAIRDLAPVHYQPGDQRYRQALDAVMGIFDARRSRSLPNEDAIHAAEALGQAGDPRLREDNWVSVGAGRFWVGSQDKDPLRTNYDATAAFNESPVHEVYLDSYKIGRYPITVEEYGRFIEDEGYSNQKWWKDWASNQPKEPLDWDTQVLYPNRPEVGVSWFEAVAYCAWAGVRLPTEAQWERAARGTTRRKYPWGDEEPDATRANYDGRVGHATPVGLYPRGATPEGILDLAGNVWEWMSDWYDATYSPKSPDTNPQGPSTGQSRVLRGGSWESIPWRTRTSYRDSAQPLARFNYYGFRCVKDVHSG